MMIKFLSNRWNLSLIQLGLYSIVVYAMLQYGMGIGRIALLTIVVWGIQFITRIKAVADGLIMRQLMIDYEMDANDIVQKIKEQAEKDRNSNNIN